MINQKNETDNNPSKHIVRGHINIIILKALLEGDKYGYEIGKYVESKSEGDYKLKQPTLYSSLKRLEDRKLIESYWGDEDVTQGGRRKYFKLTDIGRNVCSENLNDWHKSKEIIDKLISNNISPKIHKNTERSPIGNQIYDNNVSAPVKTRSEQIFNDDNDKGFEYKTIISKLLSNVKNDKPDVILRNDSINDVTANEASINNQITAEQNDRESFLQNVRNIDDVNENNIKEYNEELNDNKSEQQYIKDKSYSLLPSSSEYVFSGFSKIQQDLYEQGFKVSPYNDVKKVKNQFLLINKLNFITALLLYLLVSAETALIYFLWEPLINIGIKYYIYIILIFLILPLYSGICYAISPVKKIKKRFKARDSIISAIMLFIVTVLGITSIAMLFNINLKSQYDIVLKIIIPSIYAFNFILYNIIWSILYKSKKFLY